MIVWLNMSRLHVRENLPPDWLEQSHSQETLNTSYCLSICYHYQIFTHP